MHKFKVGDKVDHFGNIGTITKADVPISWDNNKLGAEVTWENTTLIPPVMNCSYDSLIYVGPGSNYVKSFGGNYKSVEDKCPVCDTAWTETSFNGKTFYDCIPCGMKKEDIVKQYADYQNKTNLPVGEQNEIKGLNGSISLGNGGGNSGNTQSQGTVSMPFDPFDLGLDDSDIGSYDDSIDFKVQGTSVQDGLKQIIDESDEHVYKKLKPGKLHVSIEGHVMAAAPPEPDIVEITDPVNVELEVGTVLELTDASGKTFYASVIEQEKIVKPTMILPDIHYIPEHGPKNPDYGLTIEKLMDECSRMSGVPGDHIMDSIRYVGQSALDEYSRRMSEVRSDDETDG